MKKPFFLLIVSFLLYGTFAHASEIVLDRTSDRLNDFDLSYFIDDSQKMDIHEVTAQQFVQSPNRKSLRSDASHTWIRITLRNASTEPLTLNLLQTTAYLNRSIEFYEFENSQLTAQTYYDYFDESGNKCIVNNGVAKYTFTLGGGASKTIYIKNRTVAFQYFNIVLLNEKEMINYLVSAYLPVALLVGVFIAFVLYYILIYISLDRREYLYYSLYILLVLLWFTYEYGLLAAYFGVYGKMAYNIFGILVTILTVVLLQFVKSILETPEHYPAENRWLNSAVTLNLLNTLYFFYDSISSLQLAPLFIFYMIIVLLFVSITVYLKKNPFVIYLLIAQVASVIFSILGLLFYEGLVEYTLLTRHAISIGVTFEAFILSYLLAYRIRYFEQEHIKSMNLVQMQQNKLLMMQEVVDAIAHQWRQPLAQINSLVLLIDERLCCRQDREFNSFLDQIEQITEFMSNTIDDFRYFYRNDKTKSHFLLSDAIHKTLPMISRQANGKEIHIETDIAIEHTVYGFQSEFQQVLLVIIQNSYEAFISSNVPEPFIEIRGVSDEETFGLLICDNAGGIAHKIAEKMFEPNVSTKPNGTGKGLSIARTIIERNMNATLTYKAVDNGSCFIITFAKERENA